MTATTRETAVGILAVHQAAVDVIGHADPVAVAVAACVTCGGDYDVTDGAAQWIAEHQLAVLAAAGITPFAITRVVAL